MASPYHLVPAGDPATQPLSEDPVRHAEHGQNSVEKHESENESCQRSQALDQRGAKARWKRFSKSLADNWAVEWASLLTSIALLVGLAILFRVFQGKPTTDYAGYLSFATVIAVISKAIQVTLMLPVASSMSQLGWIHFLEPHALIDLQRFDAASRGLKGNLHLVFAVPSFCAVLSAFIVITALGLEAAAQQCLETSPREYIPLLESISQLDYYVSTGGTVVDGIRDAGISAMTSTHIIGGGNAPPSIRSGPVLPQTLVYSCTGKGCNPAPYATLSFCSKCEDVTEDVVQSGCDDSEGDGDCTLNLPGGPTLNYNSEAMVMSATPVTSSHDESWTGELYLAKFTMINQFAVPEGNCEPQEEYTPYCWIDFAAQSCSIALCANVYRLDVSQGDTGLSGATELLLASETQAAWGFEVLQNDEPNSGYQSGYHIPIPSQPAHNLSNSEVVNGQSATASLGIDQNSTDLLNKYFASLFNGTSLFTADNIKDAPGLAAVYAQRPAGSGFWDTISYTLQDYGYDNTTEATTQVNLVFASIATSMGNWVRDFYPWYTEFGGYQGNPGNVIRVNTSTYKIRWAWLALPAVLEFLAFVLLSSTISLTNDHKVPVWKASSMALLYHGLARVEEGDEASCEKVSAMETAAASKRVKLEATPKGYRLVGTKEERRKTRTRLRKTFAFWENAEPARSLGQPNQLSLSCTT